MDKEIKEKEKRLALLETEGEVVSKEAEIAEKKALISEFRRQYGRDWKKMLLGATKYIKVDKETIQTLHSLGVGGSNLRDLNDPRKFGVKK